MSMAASVRYRLLLENGGITQTSLPHSMRAPSNRFLVQPVGRLKQVAGQREAHRTVPCSQ